MRWISQHEAQAMAFSSPDAQPIAFRLPSRLGQDRVHLLARSAFGFRAVVERGDDSWIVKRREYLDGRATTRLEKHLRRHEQQFTARRSAKPTRPIALRGGLGL